MRAACLAWRCSRPTGERTRNIDIVQRRWKRPVGVVSVQTFDTTTEQQTASRIQLTASDGKFYAPPDTYARIAQGSRAHAFHMPGTTRFEVPAGKLHVDAMKGFEFLPRAGGRRDQAGRGDLRDVQAETHDRHVGTGLVQRIHPHAHELRREPAQHAREPDADGGRRGRRRRQRAGCQQGQPGARLPVLRSRRRRAPDLEARSADVRRAGIPAAVLWARDPDGPARAPASPWSTGYEGTGIESLYPSNTDMLRKAKAQGATTDYAHSFGGEATRAVGRSRPGARASLSTRHCRRPTGSSGHSRAGAVLSWSPSSTTACGSPAPAARIR